MKEQNKIDRLRNELESRHTAPDAQEIWHSLEQKFNSRKRQKRRLIFSSITILVVLATYGIISHQNAGRQEKYVVAEKVKPETQIRKSSDQVVVQKLERPNLMPSEKKNETVSYNPTPQIKLPIYLAAPFSHQIEENFEKENILKENKETVIKSRFESDDKPIVDHTISQMNSSLNVLNSQTDEEKNNQKIADHTGITIVLEKDTTKTIIKSLEDKTQKPDTIPEKAKRYILRPYLGIVFNQLKPFSAHGKIPAHSYFSNYSAGLFLDYFINDWTQFSLNFAYMKMPSKIEFLKKEMNADNKIIKVLNNNNLVLGMEFSKINHRRHLTYHFGNQVTISGNRFNFIEENMKGNQNYYQQKELPEQLRNNYFARFDFLLYTGISYDIKRSSFRLSYHQGLVDVSRSTKLFNPHAFVQLGYSYKMWKF